MGKYRVTTEWSGYSRGKSEYIVEAENEDEAREAFWDGERVSKTTVGDDTESEVESIELVV